MALTDFFGNEIKVGDIVYYAGVTSHRVHGNTGVVTDVIEDVQTHIRRRYNGKDANGQHTYREEEYVEDNSKIKVKSLTDGRKWNSETCSYDSVPRSWDKVRTVTRVDVVTVVHPDHYNDEARLTAERFQSELQAT